MSDEKGKRPQLCGYFSKTEDDHIERNDTCLRYYQAPKLPIDLNVGFESFRPKTDLYFEDKINNLLRYICNYRSDIEKVSKVECPEAMIKCAQYITQRGVIRQILCTPGDPRNEWTIFATKYKGNIYLTRYKENSGRAPVADRRMAFYGPKFEQCCLSENPYDSPDMSGIVDARSQFYGVFRNKLVGRSFLYAGEIDGVISNSPLNLDDRETYDDIELIELKVCKSIVGGKSQYIFEKFKCQQTWAQSYLSGIDKAIFGFRTDDGILNKIKSYNREELERMGKTHWNKSICFNYLKSFLNRVETKLQSIDCPYSVWRFKKIRFSDHLDEQFFDGKNSLSFLPDWYLDSV